MESPLVIYLVIPPILAFPLSVSSRKLKTQNVEVGKGKSGERRLRLVESLDESPNGFGVSPKCTEAA